MRGIRLAPFHPEDASSNNTGSVLTSAVLVPLVTSLRELIESATRQLANRSRER